MPAVALSGRVTIPKGVTGLVDARDGVVLGAPVRVLDAVTNGQLAHTLTAYDGSYALTVTTNRRPVLVSVDLRVFSLTASLVLDPSLGQQARDVNERTTCWVDMLIDLVKTPGGLASSILGTDPSAETYFEAIPVDAIDHAVTAGDLLTAIAARASALSHQEDR